MIGHSEHIELEPGINHYKARKLDLNPILARDGKVEKTGLYNSNKNPVAVDTSTLDKEILNAAQPALTGGENVTISSTIRNIHRTTGGQLSAEIVKRYGAKGLPDDTVTINLKGTAGQSFGAFLAPGITLRLEGNTNDYLGKGLSGGRIIVVPPKRSTFNPWENVIAGNTVLYGATKGEVFIYGKAGERFAVRNSGAIAVVEGIGDHGCEYMTGGIVVVLGETGKQLCSRHERRNSLHLQQIGDVRYPMQPGYGGYRKRRIGRG